MKEIVYWVIEKNNYRGVRVQGNTQYTSEKGVNEEVDRLNEIFPDTNAVAKKFYDYV